MSGKPQGPSIRRECVCPRIRHVHGTVQAYNRDKCRCDACRKAVADERRAVYRQRAFGRWEGLEPAHGTRRRLQALACLGWSIPLLRERCGVAHLNRIRCGQAQVVTARVRHGIAALYDELWNVEAPRDGYNARGYAQVTRHAAARGWVPPLAWDDIDDPAAQPWTDDGTPVGVDEVAVERIISGALKAQYSPELLEAIRILAGRGWADSEIGHRIGRQPANVCKIRERNAIPSGVPQPGHLRNKETAA